LYLDVYKQNSVTNRRLNFVFRCVQTEQCHKQTSELCIYMCTDRTVSQTDV